ncbi:MAG: aminotransferase class III-fold pyridoxal phosphate-dependent enzyme, partial [Proteobacteria bacterium]|nr:aminotransferase class III-fold pyridoxal phosphate-dependent enzyme [Pseudomonadota bacterium]
MNLTDSLIEKVETFGAHNYHPLPLVLQRGSGSNVVDVDGKSYLDFLSCYSALNFGHQHPRIVTALKTQLEKLAVCSRAFYAEEFGYFSEELARFVGLDMVLAMNSGAEACETAIKIARKWGYEKKRVEPDKANIICLENNFHGRTVTIISFSTDPCYR